MLKSPDELAKEQNEIARSVEPIFSLVPAALDTSRALVMMTPDIGAQFFLDIASLAGARGSPDRMKLMEVMTRYGLVPAAPKPAPRVAQTHQ